MNKVKEVPAALLSRFRGELMGLAILLIMLSHTSASFSAAAEPWADGVKLFLQFGVDIFFLVSGLGCWYSLHKASPHRISGFYLRRARRILPSFLLVILAWSAVWSLLTEDSFSSLLLGYLPHSFFLQGNLSEWFIASILLLYLLSPGLYALLERRERLYCLLFPLLIASTVLIAFVGQGALRSVNGIFLSRIPGFLFGLWLGKHLTRDETASFSFSAGRVHLLFWASLALFLLFQIVGLPSVLTYTFSRMIFFPLSLSFCLLVGQWLQRVGSIRFTRLLAFMGGCTLEIYLLHEKIRAMVFHLLKAVLPSPLLFLVTDLLSMALAVLAGWVLRRIVSAVFAGKKTK